MASTNQSGCDPAHKCAPRHYSLLHRAEGGLTGAEFLLQLRPCRRDDDERAVCLSSVSSDEYVTGRCRLGFGALHNHTYDYFTVDDCTIDDFTLDNFSVDDFTIDAFAFGDFTTF